MRAARSAARLVQQLESVRGGARGWGCEERRALSADAAVSRVVAACVVERLPIVLPTEPSWEAEYQEWRYKKRLPDFKTLPAELTEPKTEAESTTKSAWTPAPVTSDSDGDLRSIERKMQHFVFLVVRRNGAWQLPEAVHQPGETIRQASMRALSDSAAGLDVHHTGNAPAAHHVSPGDGTTRFLMRAQFLGGTVQPLASSGITDWAWVTKDEVSQFLGPEMQDLVAKAF